MCRSSCGFFVLALLCLPAFADDQVVTYVQLGGRFVELTGTRIPCWHGEDGFMAVEANDLADARPDLVKTLKQKLDAWETEMDVDAAKAPVRAPLPPKGKGLPLDPP